MNSDLNEQRFGALDRLFGRGSREALWQAHVAVIGIGGVGSWSAEALARSGVGKITLIDLDDVCITNTNRQIHAVQGQIGREKVSAMAERVRLISPDCEVIETPAFFTETSAERLLAPGYDCVIDAIDSVSNKCHILIGCRDAEIPLVMTGGAGGKKDPSMLRVNDLAFTTNDRLLRMVRRHLRQNYDYPREQEHIPINVRAVYAAENAVFPGPNGEICQVNHKLSTARLDCEEGMGTAAFMTGAFGLAAAGEAVRLVLQRAEQSRN